MSSHDEDYPIDRSGGVWDGIFRGRSSSVRRGIDNVALTTASMATVQRELARVVDDLPSDARALAIHELCDEVVKLTERQLAITYELRAHAGERPPLRRRGPISRLWWVVKRDFLRWFHG